MKMRFFGRFLVSGFLATLVVSTLPGCSGAVQKWADLGEAKIDSSALISNVQVNQGSPAVFTVLAPSASAVDRSISYQTVDVTATAGVHYTAMSGTATLPAGQTSVAITVPTINLNEVCGIDRTFELQLSASTELFESAVVATATIVDVTLPHLAIADASAANGSPVPVVATLSAACATHDVIINWQNSALTARAGVDYTVISSGQVTIPAGQFTAPLSTPTSSNSFNLGVVKTFQVSVTSATNATIVTGTATGTITQSAAVAPSNPVLALTDTGTGSATYAKQIGVTASVTSDSAATQWCLSSSQTTQPALGTSPCAGGAGTSNGWFTTRPTSLSLPVGDGAKQVYLWISDANNNTNVGPVTASIKLDTVPPSAPSGLALHLPATSPGTNATPTIRVSGVTSGDTVSLYQNLLCTVPAGTATAAGATLDITVMPGLSVGAYDFYAQATDPAGNVSGCSTATVHYVLNNASSITFSPLASSLITGETLTFTASGGSPAYTFADSGSGRMNAATGVYTAALGLTPSSETVSVTDSASGSASTTVRVRAFQDKDNFVYATEPGGANANASVIDALGNIYVGGGSSPYAGTNSNGGNQWTIRKSSDHGVTWTTVDYFTASQGAVVNALAVDASGNIYAGGSTRNSQFNTNGEYWVLRKSTDHGLTWTTKESYQLASAEAAEMMALAVDSAGTIYAAGHALNSSGYQRWIVRKSLDGGTTWSVIDNLAVANVDWTSFNTPAKIAIDGAGSIYVVGTYSTSTGGSSFWLVRKSSDGGVTWTSVDTYQGTGGYYGYANGAIVGAAGAVYVSGLMSDNSGYQHAIVRKCTDNGTTWVTADDYQPTNTSTRGGPVVIDGTGALYYGLSTDDLSTYSEFWQIRKSSDGGLTWTTVDNYKLRSNALSTNSTVAVPLALAVDASDRVFAFGEVSDNAPGGFPTQDWIARLSTDAGSSWSTVDDYNQQIPTQAVPAAILVNSGGVIFSAGQANDNNGEIGHWLLRKSIDGNTWNTVDDFQLSAGSSSAATAISVAASGDLLVGGTGDTAGNAGSDWIIRKSTDAGSSWTTIDDYYLDSGTRTASASTIIAPTAGLMLAAGSSYNSSYVGTWIVRISTDGGASWTTRDQYTDSGSSASAKGAASDSAGHLFVVGQAYDASSGAHWIVRRSLDSGITWTTVKDLYQSGQSGLFDGAQAIVIDGSNTVYVGGVATTGSGSMWTVIKSTDGGTSWTIADQSVRGTVTGLTKDASGNLYASGSAFNAVTTATDGFIRKSSDGGVSWTTIDQLAASPLAAIVPCLSQQICAAGGNTSSHGWLARILSP